MSRLFSKKLSEGSNNEKNCLNLVKSILSIDILSLFVVYRNSFNGVSIL